MDVMLDIETLGNKPGCVILSVGAVAFDPLASHDAGYTYPSAHIFYQNMTIMDQLLLGLTIDESTVNWWRGVNANAVLALKPDQVELAIGLERLGNWLYTLDPAGPRKIWANSPDFDCAIIEHAARLLGLAMPWTFRDKCDLRTLKHVGNLSERVEPITPERFGTYHNALDDCLTQIATVQHVMKGLRDG